MRRRRSDLLPILAMAMLAIGLRTFGVTAFADAAAVAYLAAATLAFGASSKRFLRELRPALAPVTSPSAAPRN